MKNKLTKMFATAAVIGAVSISSAQAYDKAAYEAICNDVIKVVVTGDVSDVDGLISKLEKATDIGVEMAKAIAVSEPKGKKLLDYLVSKVDMIKGETLEQIEHEWHHGSAFKDNGIDHDGFDHYGPVIGAKDAVVHPLTAIVALKTYKESKDEELLEQAQAELEEIIGQLQFIK